MNGKQGGKAVSRCKLAVRVSDSCGIVSSNEIRGFSVNARLCNPMCSVFITCKYPSPTATTFPDHNETTTPIAILNLEEY
ncbi:hypothetical protein CR513_34798, partial [Mucuna pruriens]